MKMDMETTHLQNSGKMPHMKKRDDGKQDRKTEVMTFAVQSNDDERVGALKEDKRERIFSATQLTVAG